MSNDSLLRTTPQTDEAEVVSRIDHEVRKMNVDAHGYVVDAQGRRLGRPTWSFWDDADALDGVTA